jgi:hypothetical protein
MSSVISLPFKLWIIINLACFISSDISAQHFVLHKALGISTKASEQTKDYTIVAVVDYECKDEIKQARFIIIQSLNGKEITLDIVIKYLAILSLERMNCTLVL